MRTKLSPPVSRLVFALLLSFIFQGCNVQNEVKSPGRVLIERIRERFESKDYVNYHSLTNPFEQIGRDIELFRQKVSDDRLDERFVSISPSARLDEQHASLFNFVNQKETLGIMDEDNADWAMAKIEGHFQTLGKDFDPENFKATNKKLNSYSNNETGVNDLLESSVNENSISETQGLVLKTIFHGMSKASDLKEAIAINNTVEYEVLQSDIDDSEKALILSVNSIFSNNFDRQLDNLSYAKEKNTFRQTAVVVAVVVQVVIWAAIGAAAGAAAGVFVCCFISTTPNTSCGWDCMDEFVYIGAGIGALKGLGMSYEKGLI